MTTLEPQKAQTFFQSSAEVQGSPEVNGISVRNYSQIQLKYVSIA